MHKEKVNKSLEVIYTMRKTVELDVPNLDDKDISYEELYKHQCIPLDELLKIVISFAESRLEESTSKGLRKYYKDVKSSAEKWIIDDLAIIPDDHV